MRTDRLAVRRTKSERSVTTSLGFALGIGVSMIIIVVIWLLSSSLEISYTRAEMISLLPSLVGIIIATISLYLSYHVLKEQQKTRLAGTDPVVLVHLGQREDAPMLIMLHVSNVGAGAATNVRIAFDSDTVEKISAAGKIVTNLNNLKGPIRVIPQDSKVSYPLNSFETLRQDPPLPEMRIFVTYEDIDGGRYQNEQYINILELVEQTANKTPIAIIAEELGRVERAVTKMASSSYKFTVLHQSIEENRREQNDWIEEMKAKRTTTEQSSGA